MDEIKEYKQLTTIQLFEWEINTNLSMIEMMKILEDDTKFICIWNEIIAKNQIKRCFIRKIDTIENYILSQPKDVQEYLKAKKKEFPKSFERFSYVQHLVDIFYWQEKEEEQDVVEEEEIKEITEEQKMETKEKLQKIKDSLLSKTENNASESE